MSGIGIAKKGLGIVLKQLKRPGKAITKAGDKWYAKTKKLQASPKKIERVIGAARIIVPMTVAAGAGARMGIKDALEEQRKRTHAAGQIGPTRSLTEDIKAAGKKIKKKFTKK